MTPTLNRTQPLIVEIDEEAEAVYVRFKTCVEIASTTPLNDCTILDLDMPVPLCGLDMNA